MRVLLAVCLVCLPAVSPAQVAPTRYDSLFDQVMALPLSEMQGAAVNGLTIRRDSSASFVLETGRVYLLGPVAGRRVAASFVGQGRFLFTPPTAPEREQLKRVVGSDTLNRRFTTAFLLFADSTAAELARLPKATDAGRDNTSPASVAREGLSFLSHKSRRYADLHFMTAMLNDEYNEWFLACLGGIQGGPFVLRIDPYEVEEVILGVAKTGEALEDRRAAMVNQFHWSRDYGSGPPPHDWKQRFSINRYEMDVTLPKDLKFRASAKLSFDWTGVSQRWVSFWLHPDLKVDSASWGLGPATFARAKDSPILWVQRPASAGAVPDFLVHYHGDLLVSTGPWIQLKTSNGWYPATEQGYGAAVTASFDVTFHTPRDLAFASVGGRVALDSVGDVVTSHWITKEPAAHASFNIGKFVAYEVTDVRNLPVTVFINQEAHDQPGGTAYFRDRTGRISGGIRQANMKEAVGEDVALSLNFFRDAFGAPAADRFYATEIYGFHGQAFPGLIHFSFLTYQGFVLDKGEDESFRAHEMAHQWWGLGVTPKSYRDAWISEGFAEFASWWYTESLLRDSVALGKIMKKSKDGLLVRRRQAGPLWLGTRLADGEMPADYSLIVYQKGAWVLRMLRYLMRDPDSGGEEPFRRMMKDFYESYRGLQASTEDFQELVSRHARAPMDWFFDSWVYGRGIPSYEWAHTTEQTGAKLTWKLRVAQRQVPESFTMLVPVHFYFADGQDAMVRVLVKGLYTDFSAELPAKPVRVVFNESDAVLAEVREVPWR